MATEGMKQLIDYARTDADINEALMDITEFKLGLLNRMSIDDLLCIEEAGFKFSGRSLTQRRQELHSFICGNPALMAGDYETMIDKLMYYLAQTAAEKKKKRDRRTKRTRQIMERNFRAEASDSEQEDVPDDARSQKSKAPKKSSTKKSKPKQESDFDSLESN